MEVDDGEDDGYMTDSNAKPPAPSEDAVNGLPFSKFLCMRLEKLWRNKRERNPGKRWKEKERLDYILPRKMISDLKKQGGTIFPYIRLLLPEQDSRRQFHVKEKKIAETYCKALGFGKGTKRYQMLMHFTDPQIVPPSIAGDLSLVIEHVLEYRSQEGLQSSINLKQLNHYLDEIANLRPFSNKESHRRKPHHNHDWRSSVKTSGVMGHDDTRHEIKETDASLREKWLKRIINEGFSPLEHKWLVRILQKKMEIGVGYVTILKHLSPYATELWNAHNNLQKICTILADPTYEKNRRNMEEFQNRDREGKLSIWQPQIQPAKLGNALSPMISIRSSFEKLMTQTNANHQAHLKKYYPSRTKDYQPLTLQFPALSVEIKLDGERMIVHIKNGRVTMNTRNSKWFSELYSPVLGPALRRSLSKYPSLDVILDGEVESWDNINSMLVPFGENRTVAGCRRAYLKHHGMVDPIDTEKVHDENDETVMRTSKDIYRDRSLTRDDMIERGKNFWLRFRAFDILHVSGSEKDKLFKDCGLDTKDVDASGSIINLPLMDRKQILYQILTRQENEVEICPTVVIRCNGDAVLGEDYFSAQNHCDECGYRATVLDSTQAIMKQEIDNLESIDEVRRKGRSNSQISKFRAESINRFYAKVVEEYKFEGLVVKDLASPYLFGTRKFWWKFKPDYEAGEAVDIDAVILGAKFATGIRNGGIPSAFLLGVVDKFDQNSFMTLNTVNAGSTTKDSIEEILRYTGFEKGGDSPMVLGKWFREENFGLPSFISKRSFQRNSKEDLEGWKFNKTRHYPDIWIDPEDSLVLTIKGAELIVSDEFSTGLAVRFPRITKVRLNAVDGDEKKASECVTDEDIWRLFDEGRSKRDSTNESGRHPESEGSKLIRRCRFLTPEEFGKKSRKRKMKVVVSPSRKVPKVYTYDSTVLEGLTFCVLEGVYSFHPNSFDGRIAQEEGWGKEAAMVKSEEDVIEYIKRHGGAYKSNITGRPKEYIIGGSETDARVKTQLNGLEDGKRLVNPKTKADREVASIAKYQDGILKWTFVYSLVHKLRNETNNTVVDDCLKPEPQQYLVRVSLNGTISEAQYAVNRPISVEEMENILTSFSVDRHYPWQLQGLIDLSKDEQWILASKYTSLWPVPSNSSRPTQPVVVYPHVFKNGFGFSAESDANNELLAGTKSKRWNDIIKYADEIISTLPLISVMGGLVTPHLHSGVTHVLCFLRADDECQYEEGMPLDIFSSRSDGCSLVKHLNKRDKENNIMLVSPNWIRQKLQDGNLEA